MATPRLDLTWSIDDSTDWAVGRLAAALGVSAVTATLLARRGYTDVAAARSFLDPSERDSHDPYQMRGMREAAGRVGRAIESGEHIVIFGDYDADGIPGTALLATWLRHNGALVSTLIPQREAGYGLSLEAAKALARDFRPSLVITIDCGSSDHEAVAWLRKQHIDVVVTDHHLTLKGPPPTPYFINPSRTDGETYPFSGLCGCGVAYKLVQALSNRNHEWALFDLLLLSTVGDQVPLIGENRFFVREALAQMQTRAAGNLGVRAIAETAGTALGQMDATKIGWRICPRINAVGRMGGDPNMVVDLLTTSDPSEAKQLALELNRLNDARQRLTDRLIEDALAQIGSTPADFIVAHLPDATVGVAGLVAARIVEFYGRPALVVNGEGRGSGRAPRGGELMSLMDQLRGMGIFGPQRNGRVADYGGHAAACGFHNVDPRALVSAARRVRVPRNVAGAVEVDCQMALPDLTQALAEEISGLEPFGIGNPEPALMLRGLQVSEQSTSKDGQHLFIVVSDGATSRRMHWWGAGELCGRLPKRVDVVGFPTVSDYTGDPELRISALRAAR